MILRPEADTFESRQNWRSALSDGSLPHQQNHNATDPRVMASAAFRRQPRCRVLGRRRGRKLSRDGDVTYCQSTASVELEIIFRLSQRCDATVRRTEQLLWLAGALISTPLRFNAR